MSVESFLRAYLRRRAFRRQKSFAPRSVRLQIEELEQRQLLAAGLISPMSILAKPVLGPALSGSTTTTPVVYSPAPQSSTSTSSTPSTSTSTTSSTATVPPSSTTVVTSSPSPAVATTQGVTRSV